MSPPSDFQESLARHVREAEAALASGDINAIIEHLEDMSGLIDPVRDFDSEERCWSALRQWVTEHG